MEEHNKHTAAAFSLLNLQPSPDPHPSASADAVVPCILSLTFRWRQPNRLLLFFLDRTTSMRGESGMNHVNLFNTAKDKDYDVTMTFCAGSKNAHRPLFHLQMVFHKYCHHLFLNKRVLLGPDAHWLGSEYLYRQYHGCRCRSAVSVRISTTPFLILWRRQ